MRQSREDRKKQTAEFFTPPFLVNNMLDKLIEYSKDCLSNPEITFLDPSCGNGNMLIEVLKRKLNNGISSIKALETIFGCDIIDENIIECRDRLLNICKQYKNIENEEEIQLINILNRNIVCTPLSKYPNGSLDYLSLPEDETFNCIKE